ncbi:MAG: relaxase domain-containing protein [Chitinophagales bacterium]|nr:relaxase domain-containing protein [Chitinophagales bacterium]
MIRMIQSRSAGHAKAYFSDALSKSDYYVSDQELAGYWQGRLADRLGLEGITTKESFFALCENKHPETGEHLTPRTKEERTTGYDINFHCPKSVSVLHVMSGDNHILDAFQQSVTETMRDVEADSKTRVRKDGVYDDRPTGELVWANFVHQTARPVEGFSPDPHLHSHCFVFNATWDEKEQRVKAGQFRDIKRDMPYYQAIFHKRLSDKLIDLGYQIEKTDKSFEVKGVPKQVVDLFSKRTDEIGRIAKEKGITDAKELGNLGARSRSKKQKGTSMSELKQQWTEQIHNLPVKDKGESETTVRFAPQKEAQELTNKQCVDHALLHCFERASVMADRRVLEAAYRHGIGNSSVSVKEITNQFNKDERIVHVQENSRTLCTTKEVLSEEKHMVELARHGQGKLIPLYTEAPELKLKGQQAAAVAHVLTTSNRVSIIRGAAGTGKTTLMKEAIEKIEEAGKQVMVVAPTAQASRGVLKDEGFKNADTVARLLTDQKMQQNLKGQVLWVDEAGLLGTKDMAALLDITTRNNAQLILGGDTRQHASVVRGDALRVLNTVAGIKTAEVSKIYRQKNEEYRSAVEDLSKGNVSSAFEKLDAMNSIHTVDPMNLNKPLVDDYIETIKKGKSAIIISPTHAQGEAVTKEIRARLQGEGIIGKKEIKATQFSNLNLTEAEKSDIRNFQPGQIVQFNQNVPGYTRGSVWNVEATDEKSVQLKNSKGETKPIPVKKSSSYDVYAQKEINLSKGDHIRINRNGFDADKKRLNNGQILEVVSVSKKGSIVLRNDLSSSTYKIDKEFGHIAHAHCVTSYASQGKTVDEVFISQPAATFPATDAKQFYVSVSRGRERARIYTDDKEALLQYAKEMGERQSALELVGNHKTHKDFILQMQRENKNAEINKENKTINKTKQREEYEPDI